jgi:hypothetical protein
MQGGPLRDEANRLYARMLECNVRCSELSLAPLLPYLGFSPQAAGIFEQRLIEFVPTINEDPNPIENARSLNWAYHMEGDFRDPLTDLRQRLVSRLTGCPRMFEVRKGTGSSPTTVLTPERDYLVPEDIGIFLSEVFQANGDIVSLAEV